MAWYKDVFELVFPNVDLSEANKCKICEWKDQQQKKKDESDRSSDDD